MRVSRGEAPLRRVVVIGAGFFGRVVARRLIDSGITPVFASRSVGELLLDAEDLGSLDQALRRGDILVDTAGPFQERSTMLVEAAIEHGCDVIDLSDARAYAEKILALHDRAVANGVRILTSCSSIATVAAAAIRTSGLASPDACDLFLAAAPADTGTPATVRAFLSSVDWSRSRDFPGGGRRGFPVDSAAAVLLPRSWPSLRRVELWADPNAPFAATSLALASRLGLTRPLAALAPRLARLLGRRDGMFAVAVSEGARVHVTALAAPRGSYHIAAEPAVLAVESLARGAGIPPGVVPADAQVDPAALFARLVDLGVNVTRA
ncbi:MAG TPA: saccharopine dehydrogenase NADP-binding domain-containing protein [Candidatus Limnocylindria bacterium]|nr:saccharopine dehydrogenase NADP-binding domain-containing protein [Candidatus Limnocylindria bacterium]